MASKGWWLRNGGVHITWDAASRDLWHKLLRVVPPFKQAEERQRYERKLGPDKDEIQDYQ